MGRHFFGYYNQREGTSDVLWVEARDTTKHRKAPHNNELPSPKSHRVRDKDSGHFLPTDILLF